MVGLLQSSASAGAGELAPMTVWRDGADGALGREAVDMTLRLDNAALRTYPQPQQPQILVASRGRSGGVSN